MNFDAVWLFTVYASLLVFIAISGFIAFKVGIFFYRIVMGSIIAVKGIENIEGPIKNHKYPISDEKDVVSLFIDYVKNFKKPDMRKDHTKYAYMQLFKK